MLFQANEKILVTGGAGYVGSHTVHCLIDHGIAPERLVVFDNLVYGHRSFVPSGVHFYQGDLTCKEEIKQVFKSHAIIGVLHFAAYAFVAESMAVPGKYFENNLLGGINLLEAMVEHGCRRIVFSSSCAAYGIHDHGAISEKDHSKPVNPYGESKLMFEKILAWYHHIYDINSISLRYFNAAGADFGIGERHTPETHMVPLIIQAALGQIDSFTIFGNDYDTLDGTCVRDFIHVGDLAQAHLNALTYLSDKKVCEVINLGTGESKSVLQVLHLIQDISGINIPIQFAQRRSGDPPLLVAGIEKAKRLLHWKPQKSLPDTLESAWTWHAQEMGRQL